MRVRLGRREMILIGSCAAAALLVLSSFGPVVRARVRSEAKRRHVVVDVGSLRPGWFSVRLRDVAVHPDGVSSVQAHLADVRVGLTMGLHVDLVDARGGEIALTGSLERVREDWAAWRGSRPEGEGGHSGTTISMADLSIRWTDPEAPDHRLDVSGLALSRDARGTRLAVAHAVAQFGRETAEATDGSLQLDTQSKLVQARAAALTVGWTLAPETIRPNAGANSTGVPPPPPPVIGRTARAGRHSRPTTPPPPDAGDPLVHLPDLLALRGRLMTVASLLAARIEPGSEAQIDSLTWKVAADSDRVALTFGPGPLSITHHATQLLLGYTTNPQAAGTPLALRVELPTDVSDVVLTVEGGPVSLALLGVKEQAAGLVNVDDATLAGRARLMLAGDGSALTFDADGSARNVSINHPKLALETIHGLDVAIRARGAMTSIGDVRLDDFGATLGALRVNGSATLEQRSDHVAASARFEIPSAACQSLLDSVPSALLPILRGTRMAGTFAAHGRFAFDTRALDDLELKYDIQDRCRVAMVTAALAPERFQQPFVHRIYLPDGTTSDETTGPGTDDWTPLAQISPYMQTAVLTTEDGAFPKHHGFNHAAIRSSIIANLKARRFVRGASTISMQLAKNLFLSRDKTLSRKLEEVVLTDYLEQAFSKDEILELYLNVIEFGPAIYGIGPAAEYYFGRTPAELDLAECLFLSSILPSPLRYAAMREGEGPPDGWMRSLHGLMEIAHRLGSITDAELTEGEAETITFFHGGDRPPARPPVRARAPFGGWDDADSNDDSP